MLNVITDKSKGRKNWVFEPPWPTVKPWNSAKKTWDTSTKCSPPKLACALELFCNRHRNHALYPETKRPDHRDQTLCTSPKQLRKELIDGKRNRRGLRAKASWWHFFKLDPGLWLMNSTHLEKNKVKKLAKCEIMSDLPQYGDVKSTLYDRSSEKSLHSQQKYLLVSAISISQCASVSRPQNLTKVILLDPDVLGAGVSLSHPKQLGGELNGRTIWSKYNIGVPG